MGAAPLGLAGAAPLPCPDAASAAELAALRAHLAAVTDRLAAAEARAAAEDERRRQAAAEAETARQRLAEERRLCGELRLRLQLAESQPPPPPPPVADPAVGAFDALQQQLAGQARQLYAAEAALAEARDAARRSEALRARWGMAGLEAALRRGRPADEAEAGAEGAGAAPSADDVLPRLPTLRGAPIAKLGQGGFGRVFLVEGEDGGEGAAPLVVKTVCTVDGALPEAALAAFAAEATRGAATLRGQRPALAYLPATDSDGEAWAAVRAGESACLVALEAAAELAAREPGAAPAALA